MWRSTSAGRALTEIPTAMGLASGSRPDGDPPPPACRTPTKLKKGRGGPAMEWTGPRHTGTARGERSATEERGCARRSRHEVGELRPYVW
jgi:hypothetical protein